MNTYRIEDRDLNGRNFAFKDLTTFLGQGFQGQSFVFDGFAFCICTNGCIRIRINYSEYQVMSGKMFVVLPKHIFSVLEYSADVKVRTVFISLDFMHHLPITPDFDLLAHINIYPCAKLDKEQVEDMMNLYSVFQHYDKEEKLYRQIQDALVLSLVLIAVSVFKESPAEQDNTSTRQESLTRSFFNLLLQHFEIEKTCRSMPTSFALHPNI